MAMPYTHATIDVNCGYRVIGIYRAQSTYRRKQLESGKQEAGNEKVEDVNEGITGRATTPVAAPHAEMKTSGKQENRKAGNGAENLKYRNYRWGDHSRGCRPLAHRDCPPYLIYKR
jgi:hypothetical protein